MAKECKSECFLPPPHRVLYLDGNQLVCAPLTAQMRAALVSYTGPETLCATTSIDPQVECACLDGVM